MAQSLKQDLVSLTASKITVVESLREKHLIFCYKLNEKRIAFCNTSTPKQVYENEIIKYLFPAVEPFTNFIVPHNRI